jgi:hypothetical protein
MAAQKPKSKIFVLKEIRDLLRKYREQKGGAGHVHLIADAEVVAGFMLGSPGETVKTMEAFLEEIKSSWETITTHGCQNNKMCSRQGNTKYKKKNKKPGIFIYVKN